MAFSRFHIWCSTGVKCNFPQKSSLFGGCSSITLSSIKLKTIYTFQFNAWLYYVFVPSPLRCISLGQEDDYYWNSTLSCKWLSLLEGRLRCIVAFLAFWTIHAIHLLEYLAVHMQVHIYTMDTKWDLLASRIRRIEQIPLPKNHLWKIGANDRHFTSPISRLHRYTVCSDKLHRQIFLSCAFQCPELLCV